MSLNWGYTFMLHEDDRSFQGIYAGAGPYLAASAFAEFDGELVEILNASADRYIPSASLGLGGGETDQLAAAITGGYRARFPVFATDGAGARRNGMYVAANYHYLYGLRFDEFDARLQLDTDTNGLLRPDPPETPFTLDWNTSRNGHGMALDFGVAFVRNRWDFGAGVGGVANRITWKKIRHNELSLVSLFNESEWVYNKQRSVAARLGSSCRSPIPATSPITERSGPSTRSPRTVSRATISSPAWSTGLVRLN